MAPPMCSSPIITNISSTFKNQYIMVIMLKKVYIYQGLVYSPDKSPEKCLHFICSSYLRQAQRYVCSTSFDEKLYIYDVNINTRNNDFITLLCLISKNLKKTVVR